MTETTAAQTHDWEGDAADRWAANLGRLDQMLQVFGDAAIAAAAPRPGERILDVGCGQGTTSFALARMVGGDGHVLGVDISSQLLDHARADTPDALPVSFLLADAARADFPPLSFDLIFSRFGVMFFDDPRAAFTHMRRALSADGRLAFVCWRSAAENDWVRLPMAAIRDILPQTPADPNAPGPFAFGDSARLKAILADSGFSDIAIAPFDAAIPYGHGTTRDAAIEDALDMAFAVGPLSRALVDQPNDIKDLASDAVRAALAQRPGDTSILIDGAAWIVTARNGGG
ncbi:MAG: class I SAM-dependent methyltransferase [Sphingopyxis sp.]|uniref:class I SAM-dependent methyltransferase n=1 Tax=Sphingopyxis sp. TaxID=1908224 RepID=UPI002AB8BA0A|nr:class I SAM-dependent methyltransferase [Sphingopyxis sp.]MDZ3831311.1 class I SAM-dependent methyltransferase [Sphingopyxis sp.]